MAVSAECLLTRLAPGGRTTICPRYMGLEPSLYASHLLSSCVYLALGCLDNCWQRHFMRCFLPLPPRLLLAAVSGRGVAVVVTVNCFLAKFCSAFGRYLTLGESSTLGWACSGLRDEGISPVGVERKPL